MRRRRPSRHERRRLVERLLRPALLADAARLQHEREEVAAVRRVVLAHLLRLRLDPHLRLGRGLLLLLLIGRIGLRDDVERGGRGFRLDDVVLLLIALRDDVKLAERSGGRVEHLGDVDVLEHRLVVAVDRLLVVSAADVVEGRALEHLQLKVQASLGELGLRNDTEE
jgi:hypothetical protein